MLRPVDHELDELLETLGYDVVASIVQRRPHPDPRTYIGSGKLLDVVHALKSYRTSLGAGGDLDGEYQGGGRHRRTPAYSSRKARAPLPRVIADGALTPSQHHNLEHLLSVKHGLRVDVRDRYLVVLEIFEQRALSKEAKLQVELARLSYMTPFVKEWFHAAVAGEHPGFMAGGEYGVEEFLRYIRRRTVSIRRELQGSEERGEAERERLKEEGWAVVGLAGYTNAGKSTLFSALSGVQAEADKRMFTTLQPKSAAVTRAEDGRTVSRGRIKLLIEDTLGFIDGMPANLVEGFRATLRRLRAADLTILLVDASDPLPEVERKLAASLKALGDEGVRELVPVMSKVDLLAGGERRRTEGSIPSPPSSPGETVRTDVKSHRSLVAELLEARLGKKPFALSAVSGEGLDRVVDDLLSSSPAMERISVRLPTARGDSASLSSRIAASMVDYRMGGGVGETVIDGWCRREIVPKLRALART